MAKRPSTLNPLPIENRPEPKAAILLVDDNQAFRDAAHCYLNRAGHIVYSARNGNEALTRFLQFQPGLVITDMLMPDKDGIETILELKRLTPTVPIIAISGGGLLPPRMNLHVARRLGAIRVLTKPILLTLLLETVRAVLRETTS